MLLAQNVHTGGGLIVMVDLVDLMAMKLKMLTHTICTCMLAV